MTGLSQRLQFAFALLVGAFLAVAAINGLHRIAPKQELEPQVTRVVPAEPEDERESVEAELER